VSATKVTVVGGGIMGAGIAFVALSTGCDVTIVEANEELLEAARGRIDRYASQARKRAGEVVLGALRLETDLARAAAGAEIVLEAVSEDLAVKRAVFATIGAAAPRGAVLASNTSGLPIGELAEAAGRPEDTVGLHFFNPVPLMGLVEVVRTPATSAASLDRALAFCARLGKETVQVLDSPGFVTTRLGTLLMCEAVRALEAGVASAPDIDTAMRLGYNHPMGPLELADRVGLDTLLSILDDLVETFGERFEAPALLRTMVADGRIGRKSGRGFYDYDAARGA
jgi:3-hydroxybutyryl-CoA dehydrogenase